MYLEPVFGVVMIESEAMTEFVVSENLTLTEASAPLASFLRIRARSSCHGGYLAEVQASALLFLSTYIRYFHWCCSTFSCFKSSAPGLETPGQSSARGFEKLGLHLS